MSEGFLPVLCSRFFMPLAINKTLPSTKSTRCSMLLWGLNFPRMGRWWQDR